MVAVTDDLDCSMFLVRHAWLSMRSVAADALVAHGLTVAQFASLLILESHPGMSGAEVARNVASARQSANEMLGGLESAGLIERGPHPRDRRAQQIHLTDAGRFRLAAARPAIREVERRLAEGFTAAELTVVNAWLTRMADASTQAPTD
jgi:DNA-binding MarR family transcriptional regulator